MSKYKRIKNMEHYSMELNPLTHAEALERQKIEKKRWEEYTDIYPRFKYFNFSTVIEKEEKGYRVYANNTVHNTTLFDNCFCEVPKVREAQDPTECNPLIKEGSHQLRELERLILRKRLEERRKEK